MKTEEEKIKINKILIIVGLLILLVILCIILFKIFKLKDVLTTNDYNMGLATQSDNLTFYYNYNKGMVRKDKKEEKVLTKNQTYSMNYFDGKIYYTTPNNTGGIDIKSIDEDGKNEKKLLSVTSSSTKMYLQDSTIYYLTSNPNTISKVDINGENERIVLQRSVADFKVIDEKIYFSDMMGYLYSVDLDGKNYKELIEESLFNKFQILENYVYYFNEKNNKLMKINLKNISKREEVTDKLDCDIYNITTNGIYYFDKANSQISYVSLNGKKTRNIVKVKTNNTKINIVGSAIYYIDNEKGKTITKVIGINGKQIN